MNPKLKKQLKTYAGVAGALLAADKVSGQVVHVVFPNDSVLEDTSQADWGSSEFLFDVDSNQLDDFKFKIAWYWGSTTNGGFRGNFALPINGNSIIAGQQCFSWKGYDPTNWPIHDGNTGDIINYAENWKSEEMPFEVVYQAWTHIYDCGNWPKNSIMKFRINKNNDYYYGWMRLSIILQRKIIIKDFAYQTQPNVPMIAGDTTDLAAVNYFNPCEITIGQQQHTLHIYSNQNLNNSDLKLYDLTGRLHYTEIINGFENKIEFSKKGIYILEIIGNDIVFRKKVFVY